MQAEGERKQEGLRTIINPGKEAIQRHNAAIEQRLRHLQNASQAQLIQELNPLIVGWTSYYNGLVEAASMSQYDELMEQRLLNWARRKIVAFIFEECRLAPGAVPRAPGYGETLRTGAALRDGETGESAPEVAALQPHTG